MSSKNVSHIQHIIEIFLFDLLHAVDFVYMSCSLVARTCIGQGLM